MSEANPDLGAIVLAAGLSTRMGKAKMLLPWQGKTVLETVVDAVLSGGIDRPLIVTGAGRDQVTELMQNYPVRLAFNPDYADGEMLHSLQVGLSALEAQLEAVFIVLGDQPQIQAATVRSLIEEYHARHATLIIPSYRLRRGHPWLVARDLWAELQDLRAPRTLRDFIHNHEPEIDYLTVNTPTILTDLDTPEDYQKFRPD